MWFAHRGSLSDLTAKNPINKKKNRESKGGALLGIILDHDPTKKWLGARKNGSSPAS
jgi:hypothetical protein